MKSLGLLLLALFAAAPARAEIGQTSQSIVGGAQTPEYRAVVLLYSEDEFGGQQFCTGSVISPRVILTAAHCVEFETAPPTYFAYFGSSFGQDGPDEMIGSIDIVQYEAHPQWDRSNPTAGYDVGLILLAEDAPVTPLRINRATPNMGETTRLVGWGQTSSEFADAGTKRQVISTVNEVSANQMRYGSENANACRGDSGGPNFMSVGGIEVIAGISSYGDAGCSRFGAATRVDVFAESYIQPFVDQFDPPRCTADTRCALGCGSPDPDCGGEVSAGCSAGSGSGGVLACFLCFLGALVARRRSTRGRS